MIDHIIYMSGLLYMSANVLSVGVLRDTSQAPSVHDWQSSATSGPTSTRIMNGFVKPNFAVSGVALVAARYHPLQNDKLQQRLGTTSEITKSLYAPTPPESGPCARAEHSLAKYALLQIPSAELRGRKIG